MTNDATSSKETRAGSNATIKAAIVVLLVLAVGLALYAKSRAPVPASDAAEASRPPSAESISDGPQADPSPVAEKASGRPRLVDLGAGKCIPCKMMAPILEELKKEYADRLEVVFVDVWQNPDESKKYGIKLIPTQIFYDAGGKERFRHEGFFSKEDILAKWKELGVDLGASVSSPAPTPEPAFSRIEPAAPDTRPKDAICYMCDGDVNPKTRTVLKTARGDVVFCSPHCYFIAYSSIVEAKPAVDDVAVTDWAKGSPIRAGAATYVYGVDAAHRPTVKTFSDRADAAAEQQASGGNILEWTALQEKELAARCGFCDRAVYPEDACAVKVEGLNTWGCCTMCALGVAARLQKDIEVAAKDALTGEPIRVKTMGGHVAALEPETAVAWAGTKKDAEGKLVSTGCFKQAFFVDEANLRQWVEAHPTATGRTIPIEQALAEKMKLTPEQIGKACKIGECAPK